MSLFFFQAFYNSLKTSFFFFVFGLQGEIRCVFFAYIPKWELDKIPAPFDVTVQVFGARRGQQGQLKMLNVEAHAISKSADFWVSDPLDIPRNWTARIHLTPRDQWYGQMTIRCNEDGRSVQESAARASQPFQGSHGNWPGNKVVVSLLAFESAQYTPHKQPGILAEAFASFTEHVLPLVNDSSLNALVSSMLYQPMSVYCELLSNELCVKSKTWLEESIQSNMSQEKLLFLCMAWLKLSYKMDGQLAQHMRLSYDCRRKLVLSIYPSLNAICGPVKRYLSELLVHGGLQQPWYFHLDHWSLFETSRRTPWQNARTPNPDDFLSWLYGSRPCDVRNSNTAEQMFQGLQDQSACDAVLSLRLCQRLLASHPQKMLNCLDNLEKRLLRIHSGSLAIASGLVGRQPGRVPPAYEASRYSRTVFENVRLLWDAHPHPEIQLFLLRIAAAASSLPLFCVMLDSCFEETAKIYDTELAVEWVEAPGIKTDGTGKPGEGLVSSKRCAGYKAVLR